MLPKIDVPIYELKLVSTGKSIRFRPFLVKEQKLLLMASQSEDPKDALNVVKQISKNCVIDDIDIDIGEKKSKDLKSVEKKKVDSPKQTVEEMKKEFDDIMHAKRGRKIDETVMVKICDMGNGCWTHHHFTPEI